MADVVTRDGAFFPVFQPIVDLRTRHPWGVEALTRFVGDDRRVDVWFADVARAGLLVDLEIGAAALTQPVDRGGEIRAFPNNSPR